MSRKAARETAKAEAFFAEALIDGAGNYAADAEVERKAMRASADVDAAIDAVLDDHRSQPNPSILSSMVNAEPPMPLEGIRANIKVQDARTEQAAARYDRTVLGALGAHVRPCHHRAGQDRHRHRCAGYAWLGNKRGFRVRL